MSAPLCVVGINTFQEHSWNGAGFCSQCGIAIPKLERPAVDFRRRGVIANIEQATGKTGDRLMDHLQLEMSPTVISDCCVHLADVPIEDLREAMRVLCGR